MRVTVVAIPHMRIVRSILSDGGVAYQRKGRPDFNGGGYDLANHYANKTNNRGETEMKKITLYIGLNDKETKTQLISTLDAYRLVNNILSTDSTITECKGVYTHDDGSITTENTLEVVLLDFDGKLDKGWVISKVKAIKLALNQEAIAYQEQQIESELL